MTWMQQAQARWAQVSPREQRLVWLAAAVVLLAMLWWLALAPALRVLRSAPAQHQALDAQLLQMQRLQAQAQAQALQGQTTVSPEESRRAFEAALNPLGKQAQMSWQADRVTVSFKGIGAQALAQSLATLRQNARAVPAEAHLQRNPAQTWDGTLVWQLAPRP